MVSLARWTVSAENTCVLYNSYPDRFKKRPTKRPWDSWPRFLKNNLEIEVHFIWRHKLRRQKQFETSQCIVNQNYDRLYHLQIRKLYNYRYKWCWRRNIYTSGFEPFKRIEFKWFRKLLPRNYHLRHELHFTQAGSQVKQFTIVPEVRETQGWSRSLAFGNLCLCLESPSDNYRWYLW